MTTNTTRPDATDGDAVHVGPSPAWHATAVPAPRVEADEPPAPALPSRATWARLATAGWWLFGAAVLGGVLRAATSADPYRGGLSVLGLALVAVAFIGAGEHLAAAHRNRHDDDGEG